MGAGMTYPLEVVGGERLDYSCNCKGRDNIQPGGGGGQEVRSWLQL